MRLHVLWKVILPNVLIIKDVADVRDLVIQGWARKFSQASLVLIGAGPHCQGVGGLNASIRRGALKDERSSPFFHVKRSQVSGSGLCGVLWILNHVCGLW